MEKYWELTVKLPNTINKQVINDYLLSLKLANRSKITVSLYRRFLEKFFSDQRELFSLLTPDTILYWFKKNECHVKETTLRFRLSVLSSFYNFCVQEELLECSPIKRRWFPRLPQPIPKYLEKQDMAITRIQSEQGTLRNQVIVEFMLTSGCRVAEVFALNIGDIDFDYRSAKVVGKGKKIRQVHFSEKCGVLLEKYLNSHPFPLHSHALFVTSTGKRLGIRRIQVIMNQLGDKAGLSTSLHPHRLRHTFATELLSKGADLSFIADELGHTDIGTTQIYARLPKREIIAQYRKYMG